MAYPSLTMLRGGEIRLPPRPAMAPAAGVRSGPVVVLPRRIPGGVAATLDALADDALPRLAYAGPAAGLRRALRAALAERLPRPRWLANWLLDDVLDHAALLAELAGARSLRVALGTGLGAEFGGAEDGRLISAPARLRLVASYRGAGVDWLPPRAAGRPATLLRRLDRGGVAVLRGAGHPDGPGVPHRAAPDAGFGAGPGAALLLAVDALDGSTPAAQPPNRRVSTASQSRST